MKRRFLIGILGLIGFVVVMTTLKASIIHDHKDISNPQKLDFNTMIEELDFSSLYQNIELLEKYQLVRLIDTLFEIDSVPSDFIKELNIYLSHRYDNTGEYSEEDLNPYPANHFYNSWNTELTNPYMKINCQNDSVFLIALTSKEYDCGYKHPFPGLVTSPFGWRDGKNHFGIDVDLITGDSVRCAFSGMVRVSRRHGGYGNVVVVRHYNGLETTYAHLSKLLVQTGDVIDPGQVLGLGGNTGRSRGSHLHFEVRFKGKAINPKNIINFKTHQILSDSIKIKKTIHGYAAYPVGQEFYVVKSGDFLYKIAEEYGTTVNELCSWNGIRRNSVLRVGQHIRIEPLVSN